ncbi:hypothetical protein R5P06_00255 [Candidatus Thioglobus autotrophicus]|uniref:hypothetical protein n=1 Tax=Candidatus Thioglobus autotrophicus TaxID=1705394 RepID=UPI00299E0C7D|nr:hypothetical protein [Candidatus Thioglobus autotrophicus]WPE16521.1 hypothetical protein R5P06_00255 [Candidatus Thioglobus autotrophicus]
MKRLLLVSALLLSTLAGAHTLTLVIHKNDNTLSSGVVVCHSMAHCQYLIKSYEYKNKGNCRLVEVKDGAQVVYRKYYQH